MALIHRSVVEMSCVVIEVKVSLLWIGPRIFFFKRHIQKKVLDPHCVVKIYLFYIGESVETHLDSPECGHQGCMIWTQALAAYSSNQFRAYWIWATLNMW